jgi:hypothetical protein
MIQISYSIELGTGIPTDFPNLLVRAIMSFVDAKLTGPEAAAILEHILRKPKNDFFRLNEWVSVSWRTHHDPIHGNKFTLDMEIRH